MKPIYFSLRKAKLYDLRRANRASGRSSMDIVFNIAKTIPGFYEKVLENLKKNSQKKSV